MYLRGISKYNICEKMLHVTKKKFFATRFGKDVKMIKKKTVNTFLLKIKIGSNQIDDLRLYFVWVFDF